MLGQGDNDASGLKSFKLKYVQFGNSEIELMNCQKQNCFK